MSRGVVIAGVAVGAAGAIALAVLLSRNAGAGGGGGGTGGGGGGGNGAPQTCPPGYELSAGQCVLIPGTPTVPQQYKIYLDQPFSGNPSWPSIGDVSLTFKRTRVTAILGTITAYVPTTGMFGVCALADSGIEVDLVDTVDLTTTNIGTVNFGTIGDQPRVKQVALTPEIIGNELLFKMQYGCTFAGLAKTVYLPSVARITLELTVNEVGP